jgi:hypothetical protein
MESNVPKGCFLLHTRDYSKAWLFRLLIHGRNTRQSNPWWADGKEEEEEQEQEEQEEEDCTDISCMLTERTHCH